MSADPHRADPRQPEAIAAMLDRLGSSDLLDYGGVWHKAVACEFIAAYERTVTTTRLRELLAERGPGEVIPTSVVEERQADRPCVNCGKPIEPGRLYVVDGPQHIKCDTEDEAGC